MIGSKRYIRWLADYPFRPRTYLYWEVDAAEVESLLDLCNGLGLSMPKLRVIKNRPRDRPGTVYFQVPCGFLGQQLYL